MSFQLDLYQENVAQAMLETPVSVKYSHLDLELCDEAPTCCNTAFFPEKQYLAIRNCSWEGSHW